MKAAYTIATTNYISYAKTLGNSIMKYNPDYIFFICLIGKRTELTTAIDLSNFTIIECDELNDSAVKSMQLRYNSFELSCALKPYFAEHILNDKAITRLKYLDSDIMVFNSFDEEIETNSTASIFLTPHFFIPVDPNENTTNDATLLKSGVFNAGYFEIVNNHLSQCFLKWWKDRLSKYCFDYKLPLKQVFVDQSWLNLVPVYFKDTFIINHLGYNTSFYNLHERKISEYNGNYLINEREPLIFFHYTGYKYDQHEKVSLYNPKYNYENTPFLETICIRYQQELIKNAIELTLPPITNSNEPKKSLTNLLRININKILEKYLKIKIVNMSNANFN